jgi:ABC-type lipoprotein release transport system permease subunit
VIVVFAAVAAVLAAALPARRAAKLNVLEAISE